MYRILALLLILPSFLLSDMHDPEVFAATEGDPSASICEHVNLLTGDLTLFEEDYCVPGTQPIPIRRTYISGDGKGPDGNWQMFPHTHLSRLPRKFRHQKGKHSQRISVHEPSGSFLMYKIQNEGGDPEIYKIDFEKYGKGITNTAHGILSARTNLKNQWIESYSDYVLVHVADGTLRRYTYVSEKDKIELFLLSWEELPNKNKIFYEYDECHRLRHVKTTNPHTDKTYAWIHFHYPARPDSSHNFTLETSDGQRIEYAYDRRKDKTSGEKIFYLRSVNNPVHPSENFFYTPIHPGEFIDKRVFGDNRFLYIDYYTKGEHQVGNEKIKIKEEKDIRLERVKTLYAPVGPNDQPVPIQRFIYHVDKSKGKYESDRIYKDTGLAESYDAIGCKTALRFSEAIYPICVEQYDPQGRLHQRSEMEWHGNGELTRRHLSNSEGKRIWSRSFAYDGKGNVVEEVFTGDLSGNGSSSTSSKKMRYNEENLLIWQEAENGAIRTFSYLPGTNLLTARLTGSKDKILKREFFSYDHDNILIETATDNGSSSDPKNFAGVTFRLITSISLKKEAPALSFPEEISEKTWDPATGQEHLLRKTRLFYISHTQIARKECYNSEGVLAYILYYAYDSHGNLISETDPLGNLQTSVYDVFDNQISFTPFGGKSTTEMEYDASNRLIRSTFKGADGIVQTTRHTYDYKHNRTSTIDPHGNLTRFTYDPFDNLIQTERPSTDGPPIVTRALYDGNNRPIASTSSRGDTTTTSYNAYGSPAQINHSTGAKEQRLYNSDGSLKESIDPLGVRTVHTYDLFGHEICRKIISPDNNLLSIEQWAYDAFHLLSHTPPDSLTTYYVYDSAGRKIAEYDEIQRINYTYDTLGRLATISTSDGTHTLSTTKTYDLLDRVVEEKAEDEEGNLLSLTSTSYDAVGNVLSITRFNGKQNSTESFTYDSLNRRTSSTDPFGNTSTTIYAYPHIIHTDPDGIRTIETVDPLDRLISVETKNTFNETLSLEKLSYDQGGKLCRKDSTIFPSGRTVTTLWEYGINERLLSQTEAAGTPLQKITRYTYTPKEELHQTIKPDGTILTSTYDSLGRLSSLISSDHTVHYLYQYNQRHQPTKITDGNTNQTLIRTYDSKGQLASEQLPAGLLFSYSYDGMGRRTALSLPDSSSIVYNYDALYLRSVSRLNKRSSTLYTHSYTSYDACGNPLTQSLIKNVGTLTTTYDALGRPTALSAPSLTQSVTYDSVGNVIRILTNNVPAIYTYDDLSQITSENQNTYTYDSHYNRLSHNGTTYTVNELDQLSHFEYDLNGNPTLQHTPNGDINYTYDALDRLTSITQNDTRLTFTYDATHRRLTKTVHTHQYDSWEEVSSLAFLYEGENEIGAADKNGRILELRILGASPKAEIAAAIAIELYEKVYVPIHDLRGNLTTLLNPCGSVAESISYTAFSEVPETPLSPWRYSSKRTDPETGLVFFGRRYYDPVHGRWLTPDPAGILTSPNLYSFVNNNPLVLLDLYGLEAESVRDVPLDTRGPTFLENFYQVRRPDAYHVKYNFFPQNLPPKSAVSQLGDFLVQRDTILSLIEQDVTSPKVFSCGAYKTGQPSFVYTNGIRTTFKEAYTTTQRASNHAGGAEFFCVFNPTEGLFRDFLEVAQQKLGILKQTDILLIDTLRLLLNKRDADIHLFCHSQGGATGKNAINRLTMEQRSRMHVVTFGSACCFKQNGLKSLVHFRSSNDISHIFSPLGYGRQCFAGTVVVLPSKKRGFDHSIDRETYDSKLRDLITKIMEKGN